MLKYILGLYSSFIFLTLSAQTQYGYVRKIERLNRPSVGIENVLIKIEGRPRIKTQINGKFSIDLPGYEEGEGYRLENVFKTGYELKNKGDLKKYAYSSSVPLVIDMYSIKEKKEDEKIIYDKIYKKISTDYEIKYEKLLIQLEETQKDKEHIRNQLTQLQEDYNQSINSIDLIAERCSTIDLGKMSEFEKKLYICMERLDFEQIHKLIDKEGGYASIIEDANQAKKLKEITDKEAELKINKALTTLYALYTTALINFDIKSATSHLMRWADMDNDNFDNQIEASYHMSIVGDHKAAFKYAKHAYDIGIKNSNKEQINSALSCIGDIYLTVKDIDKSMNIFNNIIEDYIKMEVINKNSLKHNDSILISRAHMRLANIHLINGDMANAKYNIKSSFNYLPSYERADPADLLTMLIMLSDALISIGDFQEAESFLSNILNEINNASESDTPYSKFMSAMLCARLSITVSHNNNKEKALHFANQSLKDIKEIGISYKNNEILTFIYTAASMAYQANHKYSKAFQLMDSAKIAYNNSYRKDTLTMCQLLNNTGQLYWRIKKWDKAIECFNEALKTGYDSDNEKSPIVSMLYFNIGQNLIEKDLLDSALIYHNKALKMREKMSDKEYSFYTLSESYKGIGDIYLKKKEYIKAFQYYEKAYKINKNLYGEYNSKSLQMKQHSFNSLYIGYRSTEKRNIKSNLESYLTNHIFAFVDTRDSSTQKPYYILAFQNWTIVSHNNAFNEYKKCKNSQSIIISDNLTDISVKKKSYFQTYNIWLVPIEKGKKKKLIKLYKKNKKTILKLLHINE